MELREPAADMSPPSTTRKVPEPGRVGRWLGRGPTPLFTGVLVVAAFLIFYPSIASPFFLDDYLHRAMALGTFPAPRAAFDLYSFVGPSDHAALLARGILPWWADPALEIRFFRPLSSVLLFLEHRTLGDYPWIMHVIGFGWWTACLLGARAVFVRVLSPRAALFATATFALAPCHTIPLAWVANREALVSLTFGVWALSPYLTFREGRRPLHGLAATALFTLAVSGGEYGLLVGGSVVGLELFRRGEGTKTRALGLAPYLVPAAAYLAIRHALAYGARGSGVYADPTRDPGAFFAAAPARFAKLVLDVWLSQDGEWFSTEWAVAVGLVALLVALGLPLRRAMLRLEPAARRTALGLLVGSLLALVPVLAAAPSTRLLGASLLGVSATVGVLLDDAWFAAGAATEPHAPRGAWTALVAYTLGFLHLVHAPTTSWAFGRTVGNASRRFASQARALGKRTSSSAEVVVVRGTMTPFFLPFALSHDGTPPARWYVLAQTGHVLVTRDDERTVTVTVPKDATLFPSGDVSLFRSAPIPEGALVVAGDVRVEVLERGPRGPRSARFTFERGLERALVVSEGERGYLPAELPEPGFGAPFDP